MATLQHTRRGLAMQDPLQARGSNDALCQRKRDKNVLYPRGDRLICF